MKKIVIKLLIYENKSIYFSVEPNKIKWREYNSQNSTWDRTNTLNLSSVGWPPHKILPYS